MRNNNLKVYDNVKVLTNNKITEEKKMRKAAVKGILEVIAVISLIIILDVIYMMTYHVDVNASTYDPTYDPFIYSQFIEQTEINIRNEAGDCYIEVTEIKVTGFNEHGYAFGHDDFDCWRSLEYTNKQVSIGTVVYIFEVYPNYPADWDHLRLEEVPINL